MAYFVILGFPKGEVGELIPMSNDIDFDSIPD
jgi:uncharacterized protein (DUF3820 family)